jgi:malonate transporter
MLETILGALLPMVVTFLLGIVAAWRGNFGPKDAAILNRMALHYAVPLLLFTGTVSTPRAELSQDLPLLIALCFAIVGLYGAVLLLSRFAFCRRLSTSALAALTASAPAVPFSAVLGYLFGGPGAIPVAMASLVVNLMVTPVTILLLTLDTAGEGSQGKCPATWRPLATVERKPPKDAHRPSSTTSSCCSFDRRKSWTCSMKG